MTTKPTNPKDKMGIKKVPLSTVPEPVIAEVGLALFEGARKYGRHNYRVSGILASVYYDALRRHIGAWWEGEDIDRDSQLSHVTKAISSLVVLRDAMMNDMWVDDRPPKSKAGWVDDMNKKAVEIIEKYPDVVEPFTEDLAEKEYLPQDRMGDIIHEGDILEYDPSKEGLAEFVGRRGVVMVEDGIYFLRWWSKPEHSGSAPMDSELTNGVNQLWRLV